MRWSKLRLYPGAMLLLVPRMLTVPIFFAVNVFAVKILMCGHREGTPLGGCRKALIRFVYNVCWRIVAIFGMFTWHTYVYLNDEDVDYSEYLGTNERMSIENSIGSQMKKFYSQSHEINSKELRAKLGSNFVNYDIQEENYSKDNLLSSNRKKDAVNDEEESKRLVS